MRLPYRPISRAEVRAGVDVLAEVGEAEGDVGVPAASGRGPPGMHDPAVGQDLQPCATVLQRTSGGPSSRRRACRRVPSPGCCLVALWVRVVVPATDQSKAWPPGGLPAGPGVTVTKTCRETGCYEPDLRLFHTSNPRRPAAANPDDLLPVGADAEEVHAVVQHAQDQATDDRAEDGAHTAAHGRAADERRGDRLEFEAQARLRGGRVKRAATTRPARAASTPMFRKTRKVTFLSLTPDSFAAGRLPPIA